MFCWYGQKQQIRFLASILGPFHVDAHKTVFEKKNFSYQYLKIGKLSFGRNSKRKRKKVRSVLLSWEFRKKSGFCHILLKIFLSRIHQKNSEKQPPEDYFFTWFFEKKISEKKNCSPKTIHGIFQGSGCLAILWGSFFFPFFFSSRFGNLSLRAHEFRKQTNFLNLNVLSFYVDYHINLVKDKIFCFGALDPFCAPLLV